MKVICDVSVSKTPNNWKSQIIKSFLKMRVVEASWEAVAFSGWRGVGGGGGAPCSRPGALGSQPSLRDPSPDGPWQSLSVSSDPACRRLRQRDRRSVAAPLALMKAAAEPTSCGGVRSGKEQGRPPAWCQGTLPPGPPFFVITR